MYNAMNCNHITILLIISLLLASKKASIPRFNKGNSLLNPIGKPQTTKLDASTVSTMQNGGWRQ